MEKRYLMLKRFFILCMCLFFGFMVNSQIVKADLILDEWQIDGCHAIFFDQQPIREIHYNHKVVWRAGANITYVIDGDVSEVHFVPYDETTLSLTASKEGYEFIGWRADATASGDVLETDICTDEKTLYAVYKKTITAAFDGNGAGSGSVAKLSGTAYFNASGDIVNPSFKMPQNGFTKSGYAFSGWTHGSTGIVRTAGEDVTLTSDTTFSAKWQVAVQNFSYNESVQSWTVPSTGYYKLEIWGASGGNAADWNGTIEGTGGSGGYSVGYVYLSAGQTLYIGIGGRGADRHGGTEEEGMYRPGGYNGGGDSGTQGQTKSGAGGGATHIALDSNRGVLANYVNNKNEILLVAGGGGGGCRMHVENVNDDDLPNMVNAPGGSGGGLTGGDGTIIKNNVNQIQGYENGLGGTQTNSQNGGFGYGGSQPQNHGGGGGGGWYGGGKGRGCPGGGGSGYIGGCLATLKYNGVTYTSSTTISSNNGNGRAIITFLGN